MPRVIPESRFGWEYVHVCVADATRLAYVEVLGDVRRPPRLSLSSGELHPSTAHTESRCNA